MMMITMLLDRCSELQANSKASYKIVQSVSILQIFMQIHWLENGIWEMLIHGLDANNWLLYKLQMHMLTLRRVCGLR